MKKFNFENKGFSLVELLVVMAIFGMLLALVIVNFRHGNKDADLRDAATALVQNIRSLQSWAASGKEINVCGTGIVNKPCNSDVDCGGGSCDNSLIPTGGYGIKLLKATNVVDYQLFIDTDGCERYTGNNEDLINGKIFLPTNVQISDVSIIDADPIEAAELVFQPPTGKIYLNAICSNGAICSSTGICPGGGTLQNYQNAKELKITLMHSETTKTQDIIVNTISGKIGLIE